MGLGLEELRDADGGGAVFLYLGEREFGDRNSGHTGAHRPQALAVQLVSPAQTGR